MNPKKKTFDCVEESRKWREAASAKLNAMTEEARLAYLHALGERTRAKLRARQALSTGAMVVHEEPATYGVKQP